MKKITLIALLFVFCLPITAQTYLQEDFDSEIPSSWTITDSGDNTGDSWSSGMRNGDGLNGTNAAIVDSDADGNGPHLIETLTSPVFNSSAATVLYLDFQQSFRSINGDVARVDVYNGSDWVTVLEQTESSGALNNPDNQHINITAHKNANMQIRFFYDDNDIWAWYWLIDNVLVYNETCASPSGLNATDVTEDSATISWSSGFSEEGWEIVVQASGSGIPTGSGISVSSTSYNASGLSPANDYEVYVRSDCGSEDGFSVWAGPLSFTTLNVPPPPAPVSFSPQALATSGSNRAVVDMNGDFLDDVVSISSTNVNIQYQNPDVASGFTQKNITTPDADFTPSWSLAAADYNADGYTDLLYGAGNGVTFMKAGYHSDDIDNTDPFDDISSFEESSGSDYVFSQRSNFADINNDGHLDAFVCHDVQPNVYYINDGSGNLVYHQTTTSGAPYNLGDYSSGGNYGSIWIDYDNDHDLDMFIAKCGGEEARRTNQMHTNDGLNVNNMTISYTENASDIGLADPMQTWSSAWGDFDNDGDMDVFVGASSGSHKLMRNDMNINGTFTNVTAASGISVLTATGIENQTYDFDNDGNLDVFSNGNLLIGKGNMTFDVYTSINLPGSGSFGDLNNDGFIDAFSGAFYRNTGNDNNWIKINTVGGASPGYSNINGIGARVELHTPSGIQIRDVRSGEGFRHMSTLNTHFGLGLEDTIDQIIVYWPSGVIDTIDSPDINGTLTIHEGQSLSVVDQELTDMVIHPNPVQDMLNITTSADVTDRIASVFDINGKRVINQKLTSKSLDVSALQSGVYVLRLEANGKVMNRKFIKE